MHRFGLGTRARMEWLRRAACVGEDPELFFPVGTRAPAPRDAAAAKRVWGGTCAEERDALLRASGHGTRAFADDAGRRSTV